MGSEKLENSHSNSKPQAKPYGKIVLSLHNCLLPEEKLKNTPSQLEGLDPEIETDLRILGCELIQTAGILLRLPQVAMATGQVLFQRFYYSKSFIKNPMETTAMGCLCLASKVEEAPMRIRDIINVFHHIKQVNNQKKIQPMIPDQNYFALKTQVIKAERRVLKELGFCVHVKHPHKIVVTYLQTLGFESNRDLVQLAWNYMNDALRTDAFVRYQPETVACACIYLTARKSRILLPKDPPWFILFGATESEIQEICKQILKLYIRSKPNQEKLEAEIERIKLEQQILQQRMKLQLASGNNTPTSQASPNCKEIFTSPSRNNHSKHRSRSKSHNRSKSRSRTRSRSRDRSRSRSRTRSRSRDRRDRDRDRDKYRDMDRDRDRDRNRDRNHGDRDRDYDHDRYRDRDRSRSKKKRTYERIKTKNPVT